MATPGRAGWNQRPVTIRVDGLAEAKEALFELPEAFRELMIETIGAGSAIIESEAKKNAPYDKGDLYRSIGRNIRDDGLQAAVGSGELHSKLVEFGTLHTHAQPWLYPAFRWGARYVRKQMREWGAEAGTKVRFRTKRGKRKNRGAMIRVPVEDE